MKIMNILTIKFIQTLMKVIFYLKYVDTKGNNFELNGNHEDVEKENDKAQFEAKKLIEMTRRVMESMEVNKNNKENSICNTSINLNSNEYFEEKPIDPNKILKIEKDELKNIVQNNSIQNSRVLEKIKIIKNLEKEIKEKNLLIERLNLKIDKQHEDYKKLLEKFNVNYFLFLV